MPKQTGFDESTQARMPAAEKRDLQRLAKRQKTTVSDLLRELARLAVAMEPQAKQAGMPLTAWLWQRVRTRGGISANDQPGLPTQGTMT